MLLTPKDVVVCPPPLFHCFGCILGYMATATHGSAIVFPTEAFDPEASLRAVQEYQGTALYGVATMFLAELELIANGTVSDEGFEHLRTGIAAGSVVPAELMRKLHKTLNLHDLTICYGMTETSPVSAMTSTTDPLQKRIDTVGKLLPHVECKVVDPFDRSKTLGIGERGELATSGYLVMKEYWDDPVKTAENLIPDSNDPGKMWMMTGDEAVMDAEGYVSITGRIKDLIIRYVQAVKEKACWVMRKTLTLTMVRRGGENIHPLEIENCLLAHDSVGDASVVGLPDEKYGEVVAAFVIRHQGKEIAAKEVRDYVRERLSGHLGEYISLSLRWSSNVCYCIQYCTGAMAGPRNVARRRETRSLRHLLTLLTVPKYVFWVEDYPKTASGKIQKFKLREDGQQLLKEGKGLE